jgi:hypothetical protein
MQFPNHAASGSRASMATLKTLSFILCGLILQGSATAAELAIHFTAIRKVLAQLVFTQDGRKYLRGAPTVKCNYAYLEDPQISGDSGVLRVNARFSGRSALDVFGKCIGLGDSFEASITALPYYQDGVLRLKDVQVGGKGRDGFYIRRVCSALAVSLRTQFSYRLLDDAKLILERKQEEANFNQELVRFQVSSVRVTSDAVVLTLDFALAVK